MSIKTQIMAVIGVIVLCLIIGWKANIIYTGYQNEKIIIKQETVQEMMTKTQATISREFEQQKQTLIDQAKNNRSTTTRIIQQNQPIYSQVCIDQQGLDHLRKYKDESQ